MLIHQLIAISSLIFSVISLPLAIMAFIEIRAMAKSTHKIQYVPITDGKTDDGQAFLKKMYADDEQHL